MGTTKVRERTTLPALWDRYFNMIGVELEGGWSEGGWANLRNAMDANDRRPRPPNRIDLRWGGDGSVTVRAYEVGELGVGPTSNLTALLDKVKDVYPTHVNASCGLHVHLSFKRDLYYLRLMHPDVTTTLINRLGEWGRENQLPTSHPLWNRISGHNSYCLPTYNGEIQVCDTYKNSTRYTAVNYCKALHNTIEVRVLPCFNDKEHAVSAIKTVVHCLGSQLHSKRGVHRKERLEELLMGEPTETVDDSNVSRFRVYERGVA